MVFGLFKNKESLAKRCQHYLELGPPASMSNYVPNSLTEIIIGYGARKAPLDLELMEVAMIVLHEADETQGYENKDVEDYMKRGFSLVGEILDAQ